MTIKYVWNGFAQNDTGDVLGGATVTVRDQDTNALSTLYTDKDGGTESDNPFLVGDSGQIAFYASSGRYKITAVKDSDTVTFENVVIGVPDDALQTVDTLAELPAALLNVAVGKRVDVLGRTSTGDGYQGSFFRSSTDYSSEVAVDAQQGIYIDLGDGTYGVRSYGQAIDAYPAIKSTWFDVKGNNSTDDYAALQVALNVLDTPRAAQLDIIGNCFIGTGLTSAAENKVINFVGNAAISYTTATLTALTVSGEGSKVKNLTINAPATFDGTNATPTYASVIVTADSCEFDGATLNNVPRIGVWFKDCNDGKFLNGDINGGTDETFFTGTNTVHAGVLIDPSSTGSQGNFIVTGNNIKQCVQGVLFGNYGAGSLEQSVVISGNVFEKCWNHGYYCSGFGNGHTVSVNAFNACQIPVAVTGKYHTVSHNTMVAFTTGTAVLTDNEITGISLRDPVGCTVIGNTIRGEGLPSGAVISLEDLAGVAGANAVLKNRVAHNVIEITNAADCDVAAIRCISSTTAVRDNDISHNEIKAPGRTFQGLITVIGGAGTDSTDNTVSHNTLEMVGAASGTNFVYMSNITDSEVSHNKPKIMFDAGAAIVVASVALTNCERIDVDHNKLRCTAAWGANISLRGMQEAGTCADNEFKFNRFATDLTKLTAFAPFQLSTSSGSRVEHAGSGSPEGAIISGIGGLWRRTDGGASTTLYVKESGTSNTGWVAK